MMSKPFDAVLLVSFGGPEGPDDVMPFLDNVLRGRNVPHERKLAVAEHYQQFGGVSPINEQNRQLMAALETELFKSGLQLPIYWGNRNWHPLLTDTIQQMKQDGIQRALALVTSAFSCYSGCRQYQEDVTAAREAVGEGAPEVDKLRVFFNHPGFIAAMAERVDVAISQLDASSVDDTQLIFTAHSIPLGMAEGSQYELQLNESCRLVAQAVSWSNWKLVYQSRSGSPSQPWLAPDICDYLRQVHDEGIARQVVLVPIGFIADHMEVLFDLDTEARDICERLSLPMSRAQTVGTHPLFITALRELMMERMTDAPDRKSLGDLGPSHDVCPHDCCPLGQPVRSNADESA